jgi:transcriptional regulator with XRE-family HTH domain
MELGARIEGWLKALGRTRRELANACGVTTSAVCLWIGKGEKHVSPSHANLQKIVEFFGLTMEQFYGPVPEPKAA